MSVKKENVLENKFNNIENLLSTLKTEAKTHKYYHHYTNLDSVLKIIETKSLLLSRSDIMNDQQELEKIDISLNDWKKIYSMSFTYGTKENMALWGLYSIPYEIGARISFIGSELRTIVKNNSNNLLYFNQGHTEEIKGDKELNLYEILYVSDANRKKEYDYKYMIKDKTYYSNEYIGASLNKIGNPKDLAGTMKNEAWSYEQEVRLRLKLNKNNINFEKVKLSINNLDFKNMILTFAPWVSKETQHNIKKKLININSKCKNIVFKESGFSDLVNLRDKCFYCKQPGGYLPKIQL